MNSFKIPMEWTVLCEFWMEISIRSNLMFSFLYVLGILCFSYVASKHTFYNFHVFWISVGFQLHICSNSIFFLFLCHINPMFQRGPNMEFSNTV
jgi:hypothetical protein